MGYSDSAGQPIESNGRAAAGAACNPGSVDGIEHSRAERGEQNAKGVDSGLNTSGHGGGYREGPAAGEELAGKQRGNTLETGSQRAEATKTGGKSSTWASNKRRTGGGKSGGKVPKAGGSGGSSREASTSRVGGKWTSTGEACAMNSKDGVHHSGGSSSGGVRGADTSAQGAEASAPAAEHEKAKSEADDATGPSERKFTAREAGGAGVDFDFGRWFSQDVHWPDHGPAWTATKTFIFQTMERLHAFGQLSWPVVKRWSWVVSSAMLVLSLVSLECGLRGLKSLFRLGSASLFLLVWCTALNFAVLAGFGNLCIFLGVALAVGFFLGYTPALGVIALFGAVVLWMYGSFWTTGAIVVIGGGLFICDHARKAILITMLYSIYSAKGHGGWMGLLSCTILAFISSSVVVFFMTNTTPEGSRANTSDEGAYDRGSSKFGSSHHHSRKSRHGSGGTKAYQDGGQGSSEGFTGPSFAEGLFSGEDTRSWGGASTSAVSENGDPICAEEEVARVLRSRDHYAVLGFPRYDNIDVLVLKREYRKLAMLVHPDKNRGNDQAEEAFKRLQNAYEVLLDTIKRRVYDDDLRREEVLENFRNHRHGLRQGGRCQSPSCGCQQSDEDAEDDVPADSKRIACKRCNDSHVWISTDRSKLRARWCQECQEYHQAKDGDGWLEQSGQSFFFGIFQKVDEPRAYACADGKVYDVTEWVIMCQAMKCPANTHKPTFHVSTAGTGKGASRGASRAGRNGARPSAEGFSFPDLDEDMADSDFFDWLERAYASGMFDVNGFPGYPGAKGSAAKTGKPSRKKRKGKKQW